MDNRFEGAWSPSVPVNGSDINMSFHVDETMYYSAHPQHITHNQSSLTIQNLQNPQEYPLHLPGRWPNSPMQYPHHQSSHQRNLSSSTQSSASSNFRSSNGSASSRHQFRDSGASTNTNWSNISGPSQEDCFLQTNCSLQFRSGSETPYDSSPIDDPTLSPQTRRPSQRQPAPPREPFATCVSRIKRSGRSAGEPKYWCTACEQGFGEKYDWKRHEETYQERREMFQCDLCDSIYFIDKDFLHHHKKGHRCKTCTEKRHVETARRPRMLRTGWGCGFCEHFDTNWNDRIKHLAAHFEKGNTMADWKHSLVILSLLQRPEICIEFNKLLESRRRSNPRFGWNQRATGRVEGYPEDNPNPQLQDLLEYFTPNQNNAIVLANMAFEKGLLQKELPRPPVPPKDFGAQPSATPCDLANGTASWGHLLNTIVEDQVAPTSVCPLDYNLLNEPFDMTIRPFH